MASKMVPWDTCYNLIKVIINRIFVAWVVFVKAIFSCLNLKPEDGFLPYNMPDVFNKTGHGFTDIVICTQIILGNNGKCIYCMLE